MEQQAANDTAVLELHDKSSASNRRPTEQSEPILGYTLPDVLYETCDKYAHPRMFNHRQGDHWLSLSLEHFKNRSEELALGLIGMGLQQGDRVAIYMESDTHFCIADMGCLLAGLIDVPIYLKQSPGTNEFILRHSGARALFVSSLSRLREIDKLLANAPEINTVIVAEPEDDQKMTPLPEGISWYSLNTLCRQGAAIRDVEPDKLEKLRERIKPNDIATIVYTSGTTGEPKGVMLTHENLTFNAMTSFAELGNARPGPQGEVAIAFLPMTHIFARTMFYATFSYGITVYFTTPERLAQDLREVRPTLFATVPRVLEKVYGRVLERITMTSGLKKKLANWSLSVASEHDVATPDKLLQHVRLSMANALFFRKWRAALGGRVKYIIAGGAAVSRDLVNLFDAAGVPILQGYGLTETSPVITFNRPTRNRAGTVGEPLPGVEVKIAEDGEILTRGPHVMKGYYKNPEKTREVITEEGWFHTGDIGKWTDEGFLCITDRKKALFKLSTGKYVMPQPLENRLNSHPLVEQAVVVGPGRKYCSALLFIDQDKLRTYATGHGLNENIPMKKLIEHPKILKRYQTLVDRANEGMDHWMTIKKFKLVLDHLTIDNGMLTPTLKVKRSKVSDRYSETIDRMYEDREQHGDE